MNLTDYGSQLGREFELGCCLFATAALAAPPRLREGWNLISADPDLDYAVTPVGFGLPIQSATYLKDGSIHMFQPEHHATHSQDLPKGYQDAGLWHRFRPEGISPLDGPTSTAVILSGMEAQNSDDETEWRQAKAKLTIHRD